MGAGPRPRQGRERAVAWTASCCLRGCSKNSEYEKNLFGDISAMTQVNRAGPGAREGDRARRLAPAPAERLGLPAAGHHADLLGGLPGVARPGAGIRQAGAARKSARTTRCCSTSCSSATCARTARRCRASVFETRRVLRGRLELAVLSFSACPATASARSTASPRSANRTARPTAAWWTAVRPGLALTDEDHSEGTRPPEAGQLAPRHAAPRDRHGGNPFRRLRRQDHRHRDRLPDPQRGPALEGLLARSRRNSAPGTRTTPTGRNTASATRAAAGAPRRARR